MGRYIIRRVLWGVVLLVVVTALLFLMFRFLPTADPAKLRAGRLQSPQIIAAIRHDLGLDKSTLAQFWLYLKNVFLHFDLGYSYYSDAPVKDLILNRRVAVVAVAQVEVQEHVLQVQPELRERRFVEAKVVADRRDDLGALQTPRAQLRRIRGGQEAEHQEQQRRDDDQQHHAPQHPADDVAAHQVAVAVAGALLGF